MVVHYYYCYDYDYYYCCCFYFYFYYFYSFYLLFYAVVRAPFPMRCHPPRLRTVAHQPHSEQRHEVLRTVDHGQFLCAEELPAANQHVVVLPRLPRDGDFEQVPPNESSPQDLLQKLHANSIPVPSPLEWACALTFGVGGQFLVLGVGAIVDFSLLGCCRSEVFVVPCWFDGDPRWPPQVHGRCGPKPARRPPARQ